MLKKLINILLAVGLFLLVVVVCVAIALYFEWPWWSLVGLLAVGWMAVLTFRFLRQRLVVWRLRRGKKIARARLRQGVADVIQRRRWRHWLRRLDGPSKAWWRGEPPKSAPWFLMVGPAGAGKTALLESVRATRILHGFAPENYGTLRLEWWRCEGAVVVVASGSNGGALPTGVEVTHLARLLTMRRVRPALDGALLLLDGDEMMPPEMRAAAPVSPDGPATLDLFHRLGVAVSVRFPVYVVAPKADAILGFTEWSSALPSALREQALGWLMDSGAGRLGEEAVGQLTERVRASTLALLRKHGRISSEQIAFERALAATATRLLERTESFVMRELAADEAGGFLRGVFLYSCMPKGKGAFSAELMRQTVLRDISLARSIPSASFLGRHADRLSFMVWCASWGLASVLMIAAFLSAFSTLETLRDRLPIGVKSGNGPVPDLAELSRYGNVLQFIRAGGIGRGGVNLIFSGRIGDVERRIEQDFTLRFRQFLYHHIDSELERQLSRNASDAQISNHVEFIVRRIAILDARIEGRAGSIVTLPALGVKSVVQLLAVQSATAIPPEYAVAFDEMYRHYVVAETDVQLLRRERDLLRRWLVTFALRPDNLRSVVAWANDQLQIAPIYLRQFWGRGDARSACRACVHEAGLSAHSGTDERR
ncbi:type VI secretion protein IcmF/TssM N-terminal domain-containing protein [Cupriavidus sp. D39]|uniref:type VI secretion protein IcmF/TssM N-terminal domain-containing protein n=1 Tax=Cupriavidus sp. D39 TaxID=2997877 RepID=UPI00226F32C0|nr:type VI secretion protein IcmF/TssM N-terminal domain-containing protein [Cupriavidus sp. D39]MCY0858667.1 hypothetical protein [Cupriavidus sp. D39]